VIHTALSAKPTPVEVVEETEVDQIARPAEQQPRGGVTKH
jgi:hypothetical protein